MPGYLPEIEPAEFDTFEDAKAFIIAEMKSMEDSVETETEAEVYCHEAEDVNLWAECDSPHAHTSHALFGYVYWVQAETEVAS